MSRRHEHMNEAESPSQARLIGLMAVFVLLAVPLVAVLWEALNHLLALKLDASLLLAIPAAVLFAGLLHVLSRTLQSNRSKAGIDVASSPPESPTSP